MINPTLPLGITPSQVERIEFSSDDRTPKQMAEALIRAWRGSPQRKDMIAAGEYYKGDNSEITKKTRSYVDANGDIQINDTLSNVRIQSAFLRTNVQQKVNYALGKPMVVSVDTAGADISEETVKAYTKLWQDFLNDNQDTYKKTATNAIAKGIGWQYVTIADGELEITDIDPEEIYPDWADKNHKELLQAVRDYVVIEYTAGNAPVEVRHVEFYDTDGITPFLDTGEAALMENGERIPYMTIVDGEEEVAIGWENVPLIALKGTDDEVPMLNIIKGTIDTFDKIISKSSDSILDDTDPVMALKGYDADEETLRIARAQMKSNKIVGLGDKGEAEYLSVDINVDAVHKHLELLKKLIQYFGQMVDVQDVQFGTNLSKVAIQCLYSNLDVYINGLETEFGAYIKRLKPFFDVVAQYKGVGTAEQWAKSRVTVTFNRDMLINLTEDIQSTVQLASTGVSQQTIDEFNPVVQSHEIEEERRQAEQESAQAGTDDPVFLQEVETAAQRLVEQRESEGANQ